ncbi:MAG: aminotransferase class I/II-fold pyridoxal phosphate-dependent enzyme [Thermomicrobiales bacterium]
MKIEAFALERWMTRYENHVAYDIAESGIAPLTTRDLLDLLPGDDRETMLAALLDTKLGYSEAPGSEELRTDLAATYAATGPDEILVTTGAIEANYLLFNTLLDPGDHVVAVAPAYQQLLSVPAAIGCEVSRWEVRPEDGFSLDLDALERLVTPRTRLVVINSPHNPTGAMLDADDLRRVYALAESVGARVLSDEAYRWLSHDDGAEPVPPMRDLGPLGISVGTFSKPFGLPGLRIGWIAAPAGLVAACWGARDYVSLSPGKLNDALALLALRHREPIQARNRAIIAENKAVAMDWFAANDDLVAWRPPAAGLLTMLAYAADMPSLPLANRLAEEASVMLAPGSTFGLEGHLRIGIGQEPAIFREGLDRASTFLRQVATEVPTRVGWRAGIDAGAAVR